MRKIPDNARVLGSRDYLEDALALYRQCEAQLKRMPEADKFKVLRPRYAYVTAGLSRGPAFVVYLVPTEYDDDTEETNPDDSTRVSAPGSTRRARLPRRSGIRAPGNTSGSAEHHRC